MVTVSPLPYTLSPKGLPANTPMIMGVRASSPSTSTWNGLLLEAKGGEMRAACETILTSVSQLCKCKW